MACDYHRHRITAVSKVNTDIITSIAASSIGCAVILLIKIYVKTLKTDVTVFICKSVLNIVI